jgi:hypothetical protein
MKKAKEPGIRSRLRCSERAQGFRLWNCILRNAKGFERPPDQTTLKAAVTIALKTTSDEQAFKKQLANRALT